MICSETGGKTCPFTPASPWLAECGCGRTWGQERGSFLHQAALWLLVPLISRGGGVTDKSQAFPQVHAFKGFPHEPDATHS